MNVWKLNLLGPYLTSYGFGVVDKRVVVRTGSWDMGMLRTGLGLC